MIKTTLGFLEHLLLKFGIYLWSDMYMLWRKRNLKLLSYKWWDYVRFSSLELVAYEINSKKITWNCAELWVYRWDFAVKINENFPDKLLYLFDTFEWFSEHDLELEKNRKFSEWKQAFTKTSAELVINKMKYPQKCIIKKWYFPDTAKWLDDSFCFVSLDADLYKPIYDGLCFFYPKLIKWWYIFVHDFNNYEYKWSIFRKIIHYL